MKDLPEDLVGRDLTTSLEQGWGLEVVGLDYLAVGGGSYHWEAIDPGGARHFVTVDDLDQKGYLGASRDSAFEGLRCAFESAVTLRHEGRLDFVIAPVPTTKGQTVLRIGSRYSVAVFPFVQGTSTEFGEPRSAGERAEIVRILVQLHQATPSVASIARPAKVQVPERDALESALQDVDREWTGGPFSERARAQLGGHRPALLRLLALFDHLAAQVAATRANLVITHGEPHAGNVIRTTQGPVLIDWDTAGLAPPERDLWMLDSGTGDELRRYADASGRSVDVAAIALYRVRWTLDDIASFLSVLRSPHDRTADTEHALASLDKSLHHSAELTNQP